MNICAGLKAGIEVDIHTIIEQEKLRRGDTGTERRERLESAEKTRLREDLERKRERRQQGRELATMTEETEGEEEAEASETEEIEDPPTQLSGGAEGLMTQETAWEPMVKE